MKFLFAVVSVFVAAAMAAPSAEAAGLDMAEKRCLGAGGMSTFSSGHILRFYRPDKDSPLVYAES